MSDNGSERGGTRVQGGRLVRLRRRMRSMPPLRLVLVLAFFALLVEACAASGVEVQRVEREVEVRPTPTPVPTFTHPLTGEVYEGPEHDWRERAAILVKVDNHPAARPQGGLDDADVVYEVLAEGGITRFIAVFHSQGADRVGPVRSARVSDPETVAHVGGLFAYSGGVPDAVRAVRSAAEFTDVGWDTVTSAYSRDRGRRGPHNLFTSTQALWSGRSGEPPQPIFEFLSPDEDGPDGDPASRLTLRFTGMSEVTQFVYEEIPGRYERYARDGPHTVEGGEAIAVRNIIVQRGGVIGEGSATLLRDGRVFEGRWSRGSRSEPTRFFDEEDDPLMLAPGQTWVAVVPDAARVTVDP